MAQKFISPGVFTKEIDQSFLAQGVAGIGAVIIGSSKKGPAFEPVPVSNYNEFVGKMGSIDPIHQATYGAKNYLENSSVLNYVRVLGHSDGGDAVAGYSVGGVTGITDHTGSGAQVLAVLHHSGASDVPTITGVALDANKFVVTIGSFAATASFLTSSAEYIGKVLNTDPTRYDTDNHYLYQTFRYATPASSASWAAVGITGSLLSFEKNFEGSKTPWVMSQDLGGNEYNMFKFHTLSDGKASADDVKISIQNVKPSTNPTTNPWGTFDVIVRKFYDNDLRLDALENFVGMSMDPSDRNYIGRRIGDIVETFNTSTRKMEVTSGDFANKSSLIRVEINKNNGAPQESLPWGFRGFPKMDWNVADTNGDGTVHAVPSIGYRANQVDKNGNYNANLYWGVLFLSGGIADRMRAFPTLTSAQETDLRTDDTDFSLKHLSASYDNGIQKYHYNTAISNYEPIFLSASLQRFTLPLQGGFDGFDLRVENPLSLTNGAGDTNIGVASLKRGLDIVSDPDFLDMNLLAVPGVDNLKVTDHARLLVNDRADVLYIMDITGSTVSDAVSNLKNRELDDNYSATYYPDVKIDDPENNIIVRLKPSAVVMGAIAFSDKTSQPWFAPAGLNRGGLRQFDVTDIVDRINFKDKNDLYDNRINPITSFPNEGPTIFGQKTLQVAGSSLDRINVRRLLIVAKKTVASAAKFLVFEPNDPQTYQTFTNSVNPILEDIRLKRGIERFKVVMDTTINTPDVVDQNIMRGKIFLQPTKAAEFIDLQFVITNAGVSFDA